MPGRMHVFVVFERFQVSDHFRGLAEFYRQTFFQHSRQPMRLSYWRGQRKQKMHFDDLPVSGGAEAHAVIVHRKFVADRVQLLANLRTGIRIRIVQQANRRSPSQPSASVRFD